VRRNLQNLRKIIKNMELSEGRIIIGKESWINEY